MTESHASLFSDAELAHAAFELWASSSVGRFKRMARREFALTALRQTLWAQPQYITALIERARMLLTSVSRATTRGLDEVELALLVAGLERSGREEAVTLLAIISQANEPPMSWVSALARDGMAKRTATATLRSAASTGPSVPIINAGASSTVRTGWPAVA